MQGVHKAADSLAAGFEKAAAGFSSRKGDPSMPTEKATQVADLLKAVRAVLSEIAAGPEPAPEPQKSNQPGETPFAALRFGSPLLSSSVLDCV